jgi:hypothetical protein
MREIKFKKIPPEYLALCVDRLTRFKPTREKYERVFSDIINKFASKETREGINSIEDMVLTVEIIINNSGATGGFSAAVKAFERETFFQDIESEKFLNNKINFPYAPKKIKKVILCEGATEETLLPALAKKCGCNIEETYILGAGGKNRAGRKYLKMLEEVRLPIFVLLDSDATEIKSAIMTKKRDIDRIYLIEKGEFEDVLPKDLIIEAINFHFSNELACSAADFEDGLKMTKNIELIFRTKGLGDFKKAAFAKMVENYLLKHPGEKFDFSCVQDILAYFS